MPTLLKVASIEATPKEVVRAPNYFTTIPLTDAVKQHVRFIIQCIENGTPIPERYYRANRNSTPDELLTRSGIMHLHLGSPDTRELLFLKQYKDSVYLMCLTDHQPFEEEPIGTSLVNRMASANAAWEKLKAQSKAGEIAKKMSAVKAGILAKKTKPSDSAD